MAEEERRGVRRHKVVIGQESEVQSKKECSLHSIVLQKEENRDVKISKNFLTLYLKFGRDWSSPRVVSNTTVLSSFLSKSTITLRSGKKRCHLARKRRIWFLFAVRKTGPAFQPYLSIPQKVAQPETRPIPNHQIRNANNFHMFQMVPPHLSHRPAEPPTKDKRPHPPQSKK